MKNRLQFNRHYVVSPTREDALTALIDRITEPGFIPLIGEPMVFRYNDESGKTQAMLVIGKKTSGPVEERYHIVDTANLDEKIAAEVVAREALDDKVEEEIARAISAETALQTAIESEVNRAISAETALQDNIVAVQNELDATQIGAGLSGNGAYIHDHPTEYIDEATSLAHADHLLDAALKAESDRAIAAENSISAATKAESDRAIAAENSISATTKAESDRAIAAEGTLQDNIDAEETRAQGAESTLDSKVSALSAGTESGLNSLDGKIDAETQRAEAAEDAIDNKIDELSGVTTAFSSATVSEIARINATIAGNKVKSTGNTVLVTELANGTDLEVNVDGKTILSDNGALKTGVKLISLPVSELEANVREAFKLADAQGTPVDNTTIKIYKSSSLVSVELITAGGIDYVRITYIDNGGETQYYDLNIQQLIFEAEFKDGLTVDANHEVSVKIDPTSDAYLTVSSNGVKLSGIQNAIDTTVTTETTRAIAAENALRTDATTSAVTLTASVNTLSGATVSGMQAISAVTDNIISACGLNLGQQGGYVPHDNTHFIGGAGSLDQADVLLDQAIWVFSGAVGDDITGLISDVRNLSAETADIDSRVAALESASTETSGLTELSAATVALSAGTVSEINALKAAISGSTGILELSGATTNLSAATVYLEEHMTGEFIPLTNYEIATGTTLEELVVESADTVNGAFGKIQKQILDNEEVIAEAFNDLNDRIISTVSEFNNVNNKISNLSGAVLSVSAKTNGVLTLNFNSVEQGKYSPSASTTLDIEATGADIPLTNYEISSGSGEDLIIESADTVNGAFGKIQKQILDNEEVIAEAFNDLNGDVTTLSAATVYLEEHMTGEFIPLTNYEIATGTTLEELVVESADTVNGAFGKIQKQILDNEEVIAEAFNDVNDRVNELSGKSMNPSEYYTKQEVDEKFPKKQFLTASSVTNLTFGKFLTIVTVSSASATTLSITNDTAAWGLADGEVMEAHVIVKNSNPSDSLTVALPTSDSRVRITGEDELLIGPNSFGEINAMIVKDGNNYVIYLVASF